MSRDVHTVRFPAATPPSDVEVLVVGAGPVGLSAAVELTARGVQVAVVDAARDATLVRAGAMGHSPRVVEHFHRWGLLQRIRDEWTFPPEWNHGIRLITSLAGHDLGPAGRHGFLEAAAPRYSLARPIRRPQTALQQVFLRHLDGSCWPATRRMCVRRAATWGRGSATSSTWAGSSRSWCAGTLRTPCSTRTTTSGGRTTGGWRTTPWSGPGEVRRRWPPSGATASPTTHTSPPAARRRAEIGALVGRSGGEAPGVIFDERYDASPVIWYEPEQLDADPPWSPGRYELDPRPGHRAPDGYLDPWGDTLYDRIGNDFALLVLDGDRTVSQEFAAAAADRDLPLTLIHLTDPRVRDLYGTGHVLVRPDQHVAWRGAQLPSGGAGAVLDVVLGQTAAVAVHS